MDYCVLLLLLACLILALYTINMLRQLEENGACEYLHLLMSNYLKRKVIKALRDVRKDFLDVKIRSPTEIQEHNQILGCLVLKVV